MSLLNETLRKIKPLNEEMMKTAKERVDFLLKPVGSLGTCLLYTSDAADE